MIKLTKVGKAYRKEFYDWLKSKGYYNRWVKACKDYDKSETNFSSFSLDEFNNICNNELVSVVSTRFSWSNHGGYDFWNSVNSEYLQFKKEQIQHEKEV